jgi:V-type H+-transporting ATPase subunit E
MPRIIGSLDQLETTVQCAGRGEAHTRIKQAEERAHHIREEARQTADTIRAERVDEAHAQARRQHRQQRAEAVQAARRTYLTTREELLDQVWQQAEQRLRQLLDDAEAYAEALHRLTRMAIQTLGTGRLLLAADPTGHKLLTEQRLQAWSEAASSEYGATVTLERAKEPLASWGGLVVTNSEQRRRVDATFATRLAVARDELRDTLFRYMVQET